jgi:acyl phosphate:glycerol-3-phosphate acyltransferase
MNEVVLIIAAYLIGSIPTAVWISRYFFDIDIREYGSRNAGATNTYRVLGSKWGTVVMIVDVLKGVAATSIYILLPYYMHNEWERTNFMVGLGLASVVGHIFPIWADFRGGKGVATLFGMVIAIRHSTFGGCMLCGRFPAFFIPYQVCFTKLYIGKHRFCRFHTFYI